MVGRIVVCTNQAANANPRMVIDVDSVRSDNHGAVQVRKETFQYKQGFRFRLPAGAYVVSSPSAGARSVRIRVEPGRVKHLYLGCGV